MSATQHLDGRVKLRVVAKTAIADGVVELVLEDPAGEQLPAWTPGAHIGLCLDKGLVRQYSLCGEVEDRSSYRLAVLREPNGRGGSAFIHDQVARDDLIDVMNPRNNFELQSAPDYLFIAGGIGVTPLISMIAQDAASGASWRLVYGGRSRSAMAYVDHLTSTYRTEVVVHPQDLNGLLAVEDLIDSVTPDTLVYCCGPEGLLGAVEAVCERQAIDRLRIERFTAQTDDAVQQWVNKPFEVVLAQSDVTLQVPADKSILQVIEDAGIPVDSSCREGTCATCETIIINGKGEHRDSLLSEAERAAGESMMICVSRAAGDRLVLDL
jgi:ferredoxin-NADP reductase